MTEPHKRGGAATSAVARGLEPLGQTLAAALVSGLFAAVRGFTLDLSAGDSYYLGTYAALGAAGLLITWLLEPAGTTANGPTCRSRSALEFVSRERARRPAGRHPYSSTVPGRVAWQSSPSSRSPRRRDSRER